MLLHDKIALVTGAGSGIGRAVARAFAREGARVAVSDMNSAGGEALTALHPMGRLGTPEEVAELVAWLACPRASFVTGAYYSVDGGYLAQ